MKITVLAENTAVDGFGAEHGLSLFIEAVNHRILFDMGQTELFAENAQKLGINLAEVDFAVLSHGHYDHGGGLRKFLEINKKASVYVNKHAFEPHYNGTEKYIGLDISLKENPRLIFTEKTICISDGITLFDCGNESNCDFCSSGLNLKCGNKFIPDDFRHEQYLMIEENGKRVLISGCSHRGIMNLTKRFSPDILMGGFHFSKLPTDDNLRAYAEYLDSFDTEFFTCHCTGVEQYEFMKKYINKLNYLSSGQAKEI